MELAIVQNAKLEPEKKEISREDILTLEKALAKVPGAVFGDSEMLPLKHSFAESVYVREIFIPKGTILTGKIHRHSHPNFLMKGEVIVVTEFGGREHLKAPLSMISKAGTKRAIIALEDTVWITVHVTDETDLKKIEDYVISPTYDNLITPSEAKTIESELAQKNCLILALKAKGRDFSCLLKLNSEGVLLPFKQALEELKKEGIRLDGLFTSKQEDGTWHVEDHGLIPLASVSNRLSDLDMVGSWVAVAVGGGAVAGSIYLNKSKKTIKEPPQISAMRDLLSQFAQTGQFGQFKAGAEVPLGYGDYNMTGIESQGQSALQNLLSSGIPSQFSMGDQALQDLLQTSPGAIEKQFQPFSTIADRNTQQALQEQKRAAAFGGGLYSSRTIKGLGDIGAKGNEMKTAELAQLMNEYQNRKLSAIPLAYQSGQAQEGITSNRIAMSQQYGGLARQLNDASIKARDAEILRRREELQLPIQAAGSVLGSPWTPPVSSSPYADLLKLIGTIGGAYFGGPAGAATGSQAGSMAGKYASGSNNAYAGYSA